MRKLIMKMSVSLDGFVCDANGRKDWVFQTGDEQSMAWSVGVIKEAGLIIMGRVSFEEMAPYWPTATGPFAGPMNTTPKVLFTKKGFKGLAPIQVNTPEQSAALATWTGAQVIDGDLKEAILELKATGNEKPIVALGGGGFMQNLIATGLIDEYHLAIHPVALGEGLRIFTAPIALKLSDVKAFPKGTVVHVYQP